MKNTKWNIATVIAISFLLFAFYIFRMILLKEVKAPESTVISIVETVKNILFLIMGYYFVSSVGSKKKDEILSSKTDLPAK